MHFKLKKFSTGIITPFFVFIKLQALCRYRNCIPGHSVVTFLPFFNAVGCLIPKRLVHNGQFKTGQSLTYLEELTEQSRHFILIAINFKRKGFIMINFEGKKYYDVDDVKEIFGVHRGTVLLWLRQGKIKGKKIFKSRYIIPEEEVKKIFDGL